MDFLNLIWKVDATAVLAVFLHTAKRNCKKKCTDCVISPLLCWFQSLPSYFGHIFVWEKQQLPAPFIFQQCRYLTALCSFFFAMGHAFGLLADGLFFSTVLIKLWYIWICTREKLTRLTERICLAVSRSSWEMTQYSLKAEMLELESQYGGKNVSICNQLEQSGCSRISK